MQQVILSLPPLQGASNPAAGGEWRTWGHIWCLCHCPHLGLPFPAKVFHMALEHSSASFLQWVRLKVNSNYFISNALCTLAKTMPPKKGQCRMIFFFKWSMDVATLPEQDGEGLSESTDYSGLITSRAAAWSSKGLSCSCYSWAALVFQTQTNLNKNS